MGTDKSGGKISNPLMQIEPLIHAMWSDTRYQHPYYNTAVAWYQ